VFPSRTDTFGLVLLEALACGTPVAAFPVTGPIDVLADAHGMIGAVDADLRIAALAALTADRAACRAHAERYSWRACAEVFLSHLVPLAQTCRRRSDQQTSYSGNRETGSSGSNTLHTC
jgi:glycosyltransferase involved in cell wall biosynthesis